MACKLSGGLSVVELEVGMKEVWKCVAGFENCYEVSNNGRVRSLTRTVASRWGSCRKVKGRFLKLYINQQGYQVVSLCKPGTETLTGVHRIVGNAFVSGRTKSRNQINHINGIKDDNHYKNLEWCTPKENIYHAHETGLSVKCKPGDRASKLTWKKVFEIRRLYSEGVKQDVIAAKFGISDPYVSEVVNNLKWYRPCDAPPEKVVVAKVAAEVLRSEGVSAVTLGDSGVLCDIAIAAGLKCDGPPTEKRIIDAIDRSNQDNHLIKSFIRGRQGQRQRCFFLPEHFRRTP